MLDKKYLVEGSTSPAVEEVRAHVRVLQQHLHYLGMSSLRSPV